MSFLEFLSLAGIYHADNFTPSVAGMVTSSKAMRLWCAEHFSVNSQDGHSSERGAPPSFYASPIFYGGKSSAGKKKRNCDMKRLMRPSASPEGFCACRALM